MTLYGIICSLKKQTNHWSGTASEDPVAVFKAVDVSACECLSTRFFRRFTPLSFSFMTKFYILHTDSLPPSAPTSPFLLKLSSHYCFSNPADPRNNLSHCSRSIGCFCHGSIVYNTDCLGEATVELCFPHAFTPSISTARPGGSVKGWQWFRRQVYGNSTRIKNPMRVGRRLCSGTHMWAPAMSTL